MELSDHTHLTNTVFVEIVIVAQNGDLIRHCSTYTWTVVYLERERTCHFLRQFFYQQVRGHFKDMKQKICFASSFTEEKKTYSPSSEQMAALHSLKDVGSQFRLAGHVGLGQSLLHPLYLNQTQRPLVP